MATIGVRGAARGGVQVMADATTNAGSSTTSSGGGLLGFVNFQSPAFWAVLYAVLAGAYLALMYFGHGGSRGSVF